MVRYRDMNNVSFITVEKSVYFFFDIVETFKWDTFQTKLVFGSVNVMGIHWTQSTEN